ncbi:hypothetical protein A0H81_09702 [Grifola frondosa]|uniref:Uncharacterized protein n=1 Tax=Grifola frondosa TaxID=5627 RepID=A0A1C7M025_GRIFR|nr:hypothetical protein A0H81_09702 [Grifola frondosa]
MPLPLQRRNLGESEDIEMDGSPSAQTREESGELKDDVDNDKDSDDDIPLAKTVRSSAARSFISSKSRTSTPALASLRSTPALPTVGYRTKTTLRWESWLRRPKDGR